MKTLKVVVVGILLLGLGIQAHANVKQCENSDSKQCLKASQTKKLLNQHYFQQCENVLGSMPVEYIQCGDAVPITPTRTDANGKVTFLENPGSTDGVPRIDAEYQVKKGEDGYYQDMDGKALETCDKPSGIFRDMKHLGCFKGNRVKHLRNQLQNGDIVDWVYICRKNSNFITENYAYNELGLIGYNRNSGDTCYYAGQPTESHTIKGEWKVYNEKARKTETKSSATVNIIRGEKIPVPSSANLETANYWAAPQGGCTGCHSHGPFIRYPFNEPVCIVKNSEKTNNNCVEKAGNFVSFESCQNYLNKLENFTKLQHIAHQCKVLKPKRTPGMLYSVVSPTDENSGLYNKIVNDPNIDRTDQYYTELMNEKAKWHHPKRLTEAAAAPCTLCHAIGDAEYSKRFVNSMFAIHNLDENGKLKPTDDYHFRSLLFMSNTSEVVRSLTYHDQKIQKEAILPLKVKASSGNEEDSTRKSQSNQRYVDAIHTILGCAKDEANCAWQEHWTPNTVKQNPLGYLQANCSYCHTAGMASPQLVDEADFKTAKNVARIVARISDPQTPMPPSGQLPDSVKDILINYLNGKN